MSSDALGLFQAFGLELEYMIVDQELEIAPIADRLLLAAGGEQAMREGEVVRGSAAWSNELVLHVLEIKTIDPVPTYAGLAERLQQQVVDANRLLADSDAALLPTGMHPWMDPEREMRLWPHSFHEVYAAFDRAFDCRGHGWANLQSVHLNLPFRGDDQFVRLHAAVRLLLPILPALAASSPVCEGRVQPWRDHRLYVYMNNARRVASVTGQVVPESVTSIDDYHRQILAPMYRDIAPLDPSGILQHEWLNARGAVAKFSRHSIEIRVLDVQECPLADVAICAAISSVLKDLVAERYSPLADQRRLPTERLAGLLSRVARDAEHAEISDGEYLRSLGYSGSSCRADELWKHLLDERARKRIAGELLEALDLVLTRGSLATRLLAAAGPTPTRETWLGIYTRLRTCLGTGTMFE